MSRTTLLLLLALMPAGGWNACAEPVLRIPRVSSPPMIDGSAADPLEQTLSRQLARVDRFVQRQPSDGQPASQLTVAFLGYDDQNLYVVFVAHDQEPDRVRAHLRRRENLRDDDRVSVWLDTFRDRQRAYLFAANPRGVQEDAMWTEGEGDDSSFDTVWNSAGRLTETGYVVLFTLPFKSLRFPRAPGQVWNIILQRHIPRLNEDVYWPHVSSRVEGRLNQAVPVRIDAAISPGGNFQIIPYGTFRSFRALDENAPGGPDFVTKKADPDAGADLKLVLRDSLALDVTINPDYSQVESDEPQITVNQRFELFYPERRPFFQENSNLFATPMDNLVFTRRILDPEFGVRLTGKIGKNAIGAFVIDDTAPGRLEPPESPHHGQRARFTVFRLQRDVLRQSRLGVLYTERRFAGGWNRVGALDGRLKFARNWAAEFQGVTSATRFRDGRRQGGPAWDFEVERSGRKWDYVFEYNDRSEGFLTQTGLVPRVDIRRIENSAEYRFRPEGRLIAWGPEIQTERIWDHRWLRLDEAIEPGLAFEMVGGTYFGYRYISRRERLRPQDFPSLPGNRDFGIAEQRLFFTTDYHRRFGVSAKYQWGSGINYVPPEGAEPYLASSDDARFELRLRPTVGLSIDGLYLFSRLRDRRDGAVVFTDHTLRARCNWQFSKRLSLRVIPQYEAVSPNPLRTSLRESKRFNADFLVTYLVNPWTALYAGYNHDLRNLDVPRESRLNRLVRTPGLRDAGRQLFVKLSWLLRL